MIYAELQRLPIGFLEAVIEYRLYANAKAANDANVPGWESSPMRTLAQQIEFDLVKERIKT